MAGAPIAPQLKGQTMRQNLLVLGGSGFVGRALCERLVRAGHTLTVPTRHPRHAAAVQTLPGLTVLRADVHNAADLARLLPGHDAVVNLVAVLHGHAERFDQVHVQLPRTLAQAMQASGVRRLVQVSALGADLQGPSMYQRSKAQGEAVLQQAGLDLTVLRPSVIFGAQDRFFNLFAQLQSLAPVLPLAGAHTRFAPVWVGDVAQAIVNALLRPGSAGQTYEAFGPEVMTLADIARCAGQWAGVNAGRGRPVWPMPEWVGQLQAALMGLLPGEPLMSRDNLASMRVDNLPSGQWPGLQALGISPTAPSALVPTYLGHKGPRSRLEVWRSGH